MGRFFYKMYAPLDKNQTAKCLANLELFGMHLHSLLKFQIFICDKEAIN